MLHSYRARVRNRRFATSPGQRARHRRLVSARSARTAAYARRLYRHGLRRTSGETLLALYNPALIRKPLSLRAVLAGAR